MSFVKDTMNCKKDVFIALELKLFSSGLTDKIDRQSDRQMRQKENGAILLVERGGCCRLREK